jgi:hypothetical protein
MIREPIIKKYSRRLFLRGYGIKKPTQLCEHTKDGGGENRTLVLKNPEKAASTCLVP